MTALQLQQESQGDGAQSAGFERNSSQHVAASDSGSGESPMAARDRELVLTRHMIPGFITESWQKRRKRRRGQEGESYAKECPLQRGGDVRHNTGDGRRSR
jgi:hypothetical protein